MIKVRPAPAVRRAFAQWGRQHRIRTVSQSTFGVPADLFPQVPEELLAGAVIDGQPYIPPAPAAAAAEPVPEVVDQEPPPAPDGGPVTDGLDDAVGALVEQGTVTTAAAAADTQADAPPAPKRRPSRRGKSGGEG
ncbi:hypothetical protein [Microtetraspora malaysiensis]|uniref:Uncharacterized protein n=1 Tax=Microtetraspora malaysiensis TaxID=161358 RepID=A0ABW6SMS8_9ACTN